MRISAALVICLATLLAGSLEAAGEKPQQFKGWVDTQSWLYTTRNDFGEFDLHLEYWTKTMGNSGVSIRDVSRAKAAIVTRYP